VQSNWHLVAEKGMGGSRIGSVVVAGIRNPL